MYFFYKVYMSLCLDIVRNRKKIPITCFIKAMRVLDNYKETLHNYVYSVNGPN